jgi:Bacterial Ig-like domain (group 3)/FG-GAP-like repeat
MVRCVGSVLLALVLCSVPALAQTSGSGEVNVGLSAASGATASGVSVTSAVQPVLKGSAMPAPHPKGSITLFDGTTAVSGGPLTLAAGPAYSALPFAQVFGQPDASLINGAVQPSGVFDDFNGDGAPDLLLCNVNGYAQTMVVQSFVSAPGGKFVVLPVQSFSLPQGSVFFAPAVLDVNGDGHLDLLAGNTVAYGKGDGTFANPVVLQALATGLVQSYAVDVDVDGKVDIVAVNAPPDPRTSTGTVQYTFTVFRNAGSGQFTSLGTFPLAAPLPAGSYAMFNIFGLSFADLNGDGKPDVISQSNGVPFGQGASGNHLNAVLNHGDGTFASPLAIDTAITLSLGGDAVGLGDLNGDGKTDVVLGYSHNNSDGNYVGAALGNGDGTFGAIQELLLDLPHSEPEPPYLQLGDFDLDGKIDAVVGTGELALGKGDGTFSLSTPLFPEQTLPSGIPVTYPVLEATLTSGAPPSFVYLDVSNNNNAVFTPIDSSSVTANVALSAGTHSLTAHYSGDSNYAATVSPAVTVEVAPAVTSTAVTSSANPSYAGVSVTFTATVSGLAPGAAGTVTFSNGSTTLGTSTVANGSATYSTTFSAAGNATITATYSGDANDGGSTGTLNQAVEAPVAVSVGSGTTNLTVKAGQSGSTTLSVAGNAGFSGSINFSCTGLPANATCSFSPASLSLSGTAAGTTTLTVATGPTATAALEMGSPGRPFTLAACTLPLVGLIALLPVDRRRRSLLCAALILFAPLVALSGCGSGSSAHAATTTAPGSYTFNVVAASATASTSTAMQLTVQ